MKSYEVRSSNAINVANHLTIFSTDRKGFEFTCSILQITMNVWARKIDPKGDLTRWLGAEDKAASQGPGQIRLSQRLNKASSCGNLNLRKGNPITIRKDRIRK
jgi:hypothetical protein